MNQLSSAALIVSLAMLGYGCRSVASFPLDNPDTRLSDDRLIGKWKLVEDTNKANFYAVSRRGDPPYYHIKFWNRGGTNPTYEVDAFLSEVSGYRFLNIPYWERAFENRGYLFLRLVTANGRFDSLATCIVADTSMRRFTSSAALRKHVRRHLRKPGFYSDTLHFYLVK